MASTCFNHDNSEMASATCVGPKDEEALLAVDFEKHILVMMGWC